MKKVYLIAMLYIASFMMILVASQARAQMSSYNFSTLTTAYTEITGGLLLGNQFNSNRYFMSPAVLAGLGTLGYKRDVGLPIGFNFMIQNRSYNRLAVCTHGWITLGRNGVSLSIDPDFLPIGDPAMDTVPVFLGFLNSLKGKAGSSLRVETIGTVGNRICIVQWKGYDLSDALPAEDYNFQMQLHENGNKVVYHYGPFLTNMINSDDDAYAIVGIKGFSLTDTHIRSGSWAASTYMTGIEIGSGADGSLGIMIFNSSTKPIDGQKFSFAAPSVPTSCSVRPAAAFSHTLVSGGIQFANTSTNADSYIWSFGEGATPATLTTSSAAPILVSYTSLGSKTVVLRAIKANCTDSLISRQIVVTSAKTALSQTQVSTYPNPVSKQLFIENNTSKLLGLQIVDIVGHQVMDKLEVSNNSKFVLNIDGLSPGMYILNLQTSEGVRIEKILVY